MKEIAIYAAQVFSFIIRGKGRMTGEQFSDEISKYYSIKTQRTFECCKAVKQMIEFINVDMCEITSIKWK